MKTIPWRPGLQVKIDKNANDLRRWNLSGWVEGAALGSATVTITTPGADPAFLATLETLGADYVDVRITPGGVPTGGTYTVMVQPTISAPALRVDNFSVTFEVVDQ